MIPERSSRVRSTTTVTSLSREHSRPIGMQGFCFSSSLAERVGSYRCKEQGLSQGTEQGHLKSITSILQLSPDGYDTWVLAHFKITTEYKSK